MLDPFSFATGVAGLVSLADLVATKGYRYLRAVKDCEDEVKQLMAELDLFGGVLRRLERLAREEEEAEGSDLDAALESDYVYECQATLREVKTILAGFERKQPTASAPDRSRKPNQDRNQRPVINEEPETESQKRGILFRLTRNDLKWPLSRSKTTELINRLERHKATCVIALSANTIVTMHQVLGEQKITNEQLAELRSDQKKVLEMRIAEVYGESAKLLLDWFSPIDPSKNHQLARDLHQRGTGKWFIDGPEFRKWHETPNSALWIYGIPGAGKTILSSLIIEETFNVKGSGVAYYYCTYRDPSTQKPSHILGSLIRQLAERNVEAFDECKEFHSRHNPTGRPPSRPKEAELGKFLQRISRHFCEVSLIVDGLDECGAAEGIDRTELTRVLSELHEPSASTIRIAIASRREHNIDIFLNNFQCISIAAMSSDLELYVAAEVARRGKHKIRDSSLQEEIMEAMISGAEWMFQWVRCQLDFLFKLPNDKERRKALKTLPPDLPATYIRILERLNRDFSPQTQVFIQRVLIWLAFEENNYKINGLPHFLTAEQIAIAVSIDINEDKLNSLQVPKVADITDWCSSLIRLDDSQNKLMFSHFSVKEFLTVAGETSTSPVARKYLLNQTRDQRYTAAVCARYLTLPILPAIINFEDESEIQAFNAKHPFYFHAAIALLDYLHHMDRCTVEISSLQKFFTPRPNRFFSLWFGYVINALSGDMELEQPDLVVSIDPLHLACSYRLLATVERLLSEGADVNSASRRNGMQPIHFAIGEPLNLWGLVDFDFLRYNELNNTNMDLPLVNVLISRGAKLTTTANFGCFNEWDVEFKLDPFCMALVQQAFDVCTLLLQNGAEIVEDSLCKVISWLEDSESHIHRDEMCITLEMALSRLSIQDIKLRRRLRHIIESTRDLHDSDHSEDDDHETDPQGIFLAIRFGNEEAFNYLLENGTDLEARNSKGDTALCVAITNVKTTFVSSLIRAGADIHASTPNGETPLLLAYRVWNYSKAKNVFESNKWENLTAPEKHVLLQLSCMNHDEKCLEDVLSYSAGIKDEAVALHIIRPISNSAILQILHKHGILSSTERFRAILEAFITGNEKVLREALNQCTTDEIEELSLMASSLATACQSDVLRILLQYNLMAVVNKNEMMLSAIEKDDIEAIELLLSFGADPNFMAESGSHLVHRAIRSTQALQVLGKNGAEVNLRDRYGESALHHASRQGAIDAVKWLLANGALVDLSADYGNANTPLHVAAENGHEHICRLLLESHSDHEKFSNHQMTPLHCAVANGHLAVVETLLNLNWDPWARNHLGGTCLHSAAANGTISVLKRLLSILTPNTTELERSNTVERGTTREAIVDTQTKLDARDYLGKTCLFLALECGHDLAAKALLEAGVSVRLAGPWGFTPLHVAIKNTVILRCLLDQGADLDGANAEGNTALHLAAFYNNTEGVKLILERQPDLCLLNKNTMTALDIVELNKTSKWKACAALLKEAGVKSGHNRSQSSAWNSGPQMATEERSIRSPGNQTITGESSHVENTDDKAIMNHLEADLEVLKSTGIAQPEHLLKSYLNACSRIEALLEAADYQTSQNNYEEAETLHRRVLSIQKVLLWPGHPQTISSMSKLADLMTRTCKFDEAESMHREILHAHETFLGLNHPNTLVAMNNMGVFLYRRGERELSRMEFSKALARQEFVLGNKHPDTQ